MTNPAQEPTGAMTNPSARREQIALTKVLSDVIGRATPPSASAEQTSASEQQEQTS